MKFVCDKCSTKYSIADDRVRGRVLKIRCKSCNHVITVREEHSGATQLPSGPHPTLSSPMQTALAGSFGAPEENNDEHTVVGSMGGMPGMSTGGGGSALDFDAGLDDEWYVSFDGDQEGPYPLDKAVERIRAERPRGKEVHCWRPGFFVWLPVDEVPELSRALKPAGKPPAVPGKPAVPAATTPAKPTAAKSGSATGSRPAIRRDPTPPTVRREPTNPAVKQSVAKDPTGPRAALAVAQASHLGQGGKDAPMMPPIDSRPMPLPPPPEVPPHFASPDPPSLGASNAPARAESAPKAPAQSQVTRPEPRLYRKPAENAPAAASLGAKGTDAAPAKKPAFPSPPQDAKKPVVPSLSKPAQGAAAGGVATQHKVEEASPFAAALAANAAQRNVPGADTKIPDTGPTPLPPPPGEELPIGEASGLMNLSHLAAAAGGAPQRGTPRGSVETFGGATVTPSGNLNGALAPPPVVVVAGPAPRHTAPLIKWAAIGFVFLSLGLGGTLIYVLTRPAPVVPKPEVAEPSRHMDDKPIAIADPTNPIAAPANDPKRPGVKRPPVAPKGPVAAKPAAVDPNKGLTEEQKRLRALYGETDSSTPHSLPNVNGPSRKSAQVNEGALSAVVSQNKNSMGLCYQRVLKHDPTLKSAKMIARVKIGISGRVTNVSFGEQPDQQAEISQCLTQSIKRWAFPANDSEYDFEFPIVLQAN
jgi:predicted Zn finger-like uncharacterized protein